MAYRLLVTGEAENDLDAILAYIVYELCNMQAAKELADKIDAHYGLLAENPKLYAECREPLLQRQHYRKVTLGGYIMIYREDDATNTVYVERFFSNLQDYANRL